MPIDNISYILSFTAGIASFLSPCVLPIVPGSIAFLSGQTINHIKEEHVEKPSLKWSVLLSAIIFVLGFSTIFIALGASATFIGHYLLQYLDILTKIAGIIIMIFGFHMVGLLRTHLFNKEIRFHFSSNLGSYYGPYLIGLAFGFGWTPCIGPILGVILTYASHQDTMQQGVLLLFFYAMGLGIPFILSACFINYFLQSYKNYKQIMPIIQKSMGVLLIVTGGIITTGFIGVIANWMLVNISFLNIYS